MRRADARLSPPARQRPRSADHALLALALLAGGTSSVLAGQDVSFDQLHYHYYLGWSLLAGRLDQDIAAAGIGTFLNPLIHALTYLGITHLPPRLFGFLLGAVHGLNVFLVYRIASRVLEGVRWQRPLAALSAAAAFRGPGAVSLLGTTFGDNLVSIPALLALQLLLGVTGLPSRRRVVAAGLLAGGAAGLKLTYGLFLAPLGLVVLLMSLRRGGWRPPLAFAGAAFVGVLLTGGYWGFQLWTRLGNPVFPLANNLFHSPYFDPSAFRDVRWRAHGLSELLATPLDIAAGHTGSFQEVSFRDGRYLVLAVVAAAAALRRLGPTAQRGPWSPAATSLTVYFGAAFALWLVGIHYYRYFVAGECLVPAVTVALLAMALPRSLPAAWVALVLTITMTSSTGDWGRVPWARDWYRVQGPQGFVPPNSIVLVGGGLLSYTLPFFPAGTRFFGLVGAQTRGFDPQIDRELRGHSGPILLLARADNPVPTPLSRFGLRLTDVCARVRTRPRSRLELCRLARSD